MKRSRLLGAWLAGTASLCVAGTANAAFVMTIDDLATIGTDVTVTDSNNDGLVSFLGAVGAYGVNVTTGISVPLATGSQLLHLNSIDVSGGAGDLVISLTDTDYTGSPPAFDGLFGGTAAPGGSIDFDFYYDDGNAQFGTAAQIFSATNNQNALSGGGSSPASVTDPYSLKIIATIHHTVAGVSSFDAEIRAVPVPAAAWLFGSGLLGLAGMARRSKAV